MPELSAMSEVSDTAPERGLRAWVQAHVPAWVPKQGTRLFAGLQMMGNLLLISDARDRGNNHQSWANKIELGATALGLAIPEKGQSEEERARLDAMSAPRYVFERVKQALNPFKNIRATLGLASMVSGMFTFLSGNKAGLTPEERLGNRLYGGFFTTAGTALLFSKDDAKGWKRFGGIMMANFVSGLIRSYGSAKEGADQAQSSWKVTAAMVSFQASNLVAYLFPGTKKEEPTKAAQDYAGYMTKTQSVAQRLIAETAMGSPAQAEHMGWLADAGVSPKDFANVCAGFARGVDYISKKFGTEPKAVVINDRVGSGQNQSWVHYNPETETIFFARKFIQTLVHDRFCIQPKTSPLLLKAEDAAMAYGVEEAYHHYQECYHPKKKYFSDLELLLPDGRYDDQNAMERDAETVVRQALIDLEMLNNLTRPKFASTERMNWYESNKVKESARADAFRLKSDYRQQRIAQLVQANEQTAQIG